MAMLLTNGGRILVELLRGNTHLVLMGRIALIETLITLPALLAVLPLYRVIHLRCASDY